MAGPIRRRVIALVALAIGFGVLTGAASATAAPSSHSSTSQTTVQAADWWW